MAISLKRIGWENLPSVKTALSKTNLNQMEQNAEDAVNEVDTKVESNIQDISNIKEEQTTQNNRLISIETKNTNQDNLIEKLQQENAKLKSQIPTGKEVGEDITLTDSSNMPFNKFVVRGKSEQETRESRNLLALKNGNLSVNGIDVVVADGIISINGTTTNATYINLAPKLANLLQTNSSVIIDVSTEETYTLSKETSGDFTPVGGNYLCFGDASNAEVCGGFNFGNTEIAQKVFTDKIYNVWLYIAKDCVFSNYKIKFQLEKGESKTEWESGELVTTPNPEYPLDIRNVGDDINLFETEKWNLCQTDSGHPVLKESLTDITIKNSSSHNVEFDTTTTYRGVVSDLVEVKKGQELTVSFEQENINRLYIMQYDTNKQFVKNLNQTAEIKNTTMIIENDGYIAIGFANTVATLNCKVYNIKLQEGTIVTAYSPYGYGSVEIEKVNKNLVITENCKNATINADGTLTIGENRLSSTYISINSEKSMLAFSINTEMLFLGLAFYDKNKVFIKREAINSNNKIIASIPDNAKYAICFMSTTEITFNEQSFYTYELQLEYETVTPYTPHQSETFIFPVAEPLHEGDELAEDGIHDNMVCEIFDGTETDWQIRSDLTTDEYVVFKQSKYVKDSGLITNSNGFSNYFEVVTNAQSDSNNIRFINENGYGIHLKISKNIVSTVDELKTWLAEKNAKGNPLVIYYPSSKEKITPYTEEQQTIYNNILNSNTYKNITHISAGGDVKPDLEVGYYRDLDTVLNNLANAIVALGGVI